MLIERMRRRLAAEAKFIEPCLPSPSDKPPSGSNWIHEIKHDGYRLMARRDPVGIRLITRRGNDWTTRYPLVVEAVNHLKVRSCLLDGEVVCCDEKGVCLSVAPPPPERTHSSTRSRYRSGRSPDWLKFKNPAAQAVKQEAEEDWGR
jgi:ATP-dependent DNA ligase